jgi:drug/metabolite transporter (DMT)-like permease
VENDGDAGRNLADAGSLNQTAGEHPDTQAHAWFRVLPPVLLCALLWGSAFPCIKMVYRIWKDAGIQAGLYEYWWFAGIRFTLGGIMLLAVARSPFQEIRRSPLRTLLGFSFTQTFGQYVLFYYGMAVSSGSLMGLMSSLGSFWWMLLAPLMTAAAWPSRGQWLAILVGGVGVGLAAFAPGAGAGQPILGTLLLAGATALGAVAVFQFATLRQTMGACAATGFSLLVGGVGLMILGGRSFSHLHEMLTLPVILLTLWLAFVSAYAFNLWNQLSIRFPMPLMAGYRFLIPLAGVIESVIFLHEKPGPGLIWGGGLVIGSLFVSQRVARRS